VVQNRHQLFYYIYLCNHTKLQQSKHSSLHPKIMPYWVVERLIWQTWESLHQSTSNSPWVSHETFGNQAHASLACNFRQHFRNYPPVVFFWAKSPPISINNPISGFVISRLVAGLWKHLLARLGMVCEEPNEDDGRGMIVSWGPEKRMHRRETRWIRGDAFCSRSYIGKKGVYSRSWLTHRSGSSLGWSSNLPSLRKPSNFWSESSSSQSYSRMGLLSEWPVDVMQSDWSLLGRSVDPTLVNCCRDVDPHHPILMLSPPLHSSHSGRARIRSPGCGSAHL
jgi:hypothetical protein